MTKITIDGQEYEVKEGQNLLQAALSQGLDLPYFCWHPALGSVGACRQCAVKQYKDENDTHGKLVMACMTPAAEGGRFSIQDPEAREFRSSVVEWLMVNHPHDCPVCDEGGECHLQDMTVMTGHTYREYNFQKRTYRNQYLGPFINHEMNRCIQCYRCVRFYREYAGGRDFNVFAAHDHVYFGRQEDGTLENEFSGNLVEICPTGVFTDKTFKQHYTRKWDLQTAPSICVQCGLGCNIIPGERYGKLRRIRNRYNGAVNGYFLCDRGRYGYEFVNSEQRIQQPLLRKNKGEALQAVSETEALEKIAAILENASGMIGIGSPRASLESNYALRKLVGPDQYVLGFSQQDDRLIRLGREILQNGSVRTPSLKEIEAADVVLVLGEDVTNTAPRMALALRQLVHTKACRIAEEFDIPNWNDIAIREVIQHEKETMYIATPAATKLDDISHHTFRLAPDELARLGYAIAHAIDPTAPEVKDFSPDLHDQVNEIAQALAEAEQPLVISGTSTGSAAVMQAAANVAYALHRTGRPAWLSLTVPEANSLGLALIGGGSLAEAAQAIQSGQADTLIILENDLYRRAERASVEALLAAAEHIIVLDTLDNDTLRQAEVVLPAGAYVETDSTWVNNEGRAQRAYQVYQPPAPIQSSWRWLESLLVQAGRQNQADWETIDQLLAEIAAELAGFGPILEIAPPADFRLVGQKIPRQPARFSGRTSIHAAASVHEPQPPADPDTPLAFSMEGYQGQPPAALIPRFWTPGWNSVQSLNKFQAEINGPLKGGDPGKRLVEPQEQSPAPAYYDQAPAAFIPDPANWLLLPLVHIFGSEPLSMHTPGIAERAPQPYLAVNAQDAASQGWADGELVEVMVDQQRYRLPIQKMDELARGVIGAPVGITELSLYDLPRRVQLAKAEGDA